MSTGCSVSTESPAAAYAALSASRGESSATPEHLERLAVAAYLVGRDGESQDAYARAHEEWIRRGEPARAARCAFWLAFGFLLSGEAVQCAGWLARARRLLDEGDLDCVEQGYVRLVSGLQAMFGGDPAGAHTDFDRAVSIGERFADPDVTAIARLSRGQALIRLGHIRAGVAEFDEVMVPVTAGEVSTVAAGVVYCAVLLECRSIFDVRRSREWTVALSRWLAARPDLVPYRGQCLVHRSEILQLQGEWPDAVREAHEACERLSGQPAAGMAFYQLAEMCRLRGRFDEAEEAYRQASRHGRHPQPGLALLRLAQGRAEAATTAIGLALDETHDSLSRCHLLSAHVQIMLAVDDLSAARTAADELTRIAADLGAAVLQALSAQSVGSVRLAAGDGRAALTDLRRAWTTWRDLDAPYGAACTRTLMGLACRQLGDEDGAALEFDAAAWVFRQLGAEPDLARVEALSQGSASSNVDALSGREREVLALVAAGRTNRQIATELLISEHTVRRHLQNIFVKLDVPSRAAATAYALRHGLI
jgi:DNA-binding CsgD family transcriptional regulator